MQLNLDLTAVIWQSIKQIRISRTRLYLQRFVKFVLTLSTVYVRINCSSLDLSLDGKYQL
jgi:hypothetical protein